MSDFLLFVQREGKCHNHFSFRRVRVGLVVKKAVERHRPSGIKGSKHLIWIPESCQARSKHWLRRQQE